MKQFQLSLVDKGGFVIYCEYFDIKETRSIPKALGVLSDRYDAECLLAVVDIDIVADVHWCKQVPITDDRPLCDWYFEEVSNESQDL